MAEKLPDQLFVTFVKYTSRVYPDGYDKPSIDTEILSGFLQPHQPNRVADENRKKVQFRDAYGYQSIVYQDAWGQWCKKGGIFDYATRQNVPFDGPIELDVAPQIWDNVPMVGFEITDTGARVRGIKTFKVYDPRSKAALEISSQSLFGLVMDGEIKGGKILSPCMWKSGKMLVVA